MAVMEEIASIRIMIVNPMAKMIHTPTQVSYCVTLDKSNLNTAYGGYTSNQSTLAKYKQKQANKDSKTSQNKSVVDITGSSTKKP